MESTELFQSPADTSVKFPLKRRWLGYKRFFKYFYDTQFKGRAHELSEGLVR